MSALLERLGTIVGFLIGVSLIIFGIVWPDNLSNYYVYKINIFENRVVELKKEGATRSQIQAVQEEQGAFQGSIEAGITRFLDLKSFLIVLGGAYAATMIAFPMRRAMRTVVYIASVFQRERGDWEFETVYNAMLEYGDYRFRNEIIPDEKVNEVPLYFLRDAINNFVQVDFVSEEMVQEIINSEIESFEFEQGQEISVLEYLGKVAPAFGMLGTVVGLILLLGRAAGGSADIVGIMGGMSVALITTLYGVLLSQLIFLPVATKLTRQKESYIKLYEMIREGTLYLHRRERPDVMEQDLQIYLSKKKRIRIQQERRAAAASGDLGI